MLAQQFDWINDIPKAKCLKRQKMGPFAPASHIETNSQILSFFCLTDGSLTQVLF